MKVKVQVNSRSGSPTNERRAKFQQLLVKYNQKSNLNPTGVQGFDNKGRKKKDALTLKDMDKLHFRNEDDELVDINEENELLRAKLKVLNEYLNQMVDSTMTSNNQE